MYRLIMRFASIVLLMILHLAAHTQTVLMHEGFESGSLPADWQQVYSSVPSTDWKFQNGGFVYSSASFDYEKTPPVANSGNYNAVFHSTSSSETMLISPKFDLTGGKVTKLEYFHTQGCFYNQALNIYYREGKYGPWNLLRSNNSVVFSWEKDSIIVPSVADSVYFAFQGIWDGGCGVCLDDISVLRLQPCVATFRVKDQFGMPVSGAIVTFNEVTSITDVSGIAVFPKAYEGVGFNYNVRKNGFAPSGGKLNLSADATFDITLYPSRIIYVSQSLATLRQNGTTWDSAYVSIEDALADAKRGDQIWIAEGVYYPTKQWNVSTPRAFSFAMKKEVALFGGFAGIPGTEADLASQDVEKFKTVLSGDIDRNDQTDASGITTSIKGNNALFVIFNNANELDNTSILNGLYISGGDANLGAYRWGAAIYNHKTSPTLVNCRIVGNRASGGGVVYNNDCTPQYFATKIELNSGGGMQNTYSPAVIVDCQFNSNTTYGVSNYYSDMTIKRSKFAENGTHGITNESSSIKFKDCQFNRNIGSGANNIFGSNTQFDSCSFYYNAVYGIYAENSSAILDSCLFIGNGKAAIVAEDPSTAETLQTTSSKFVANGDRTINGGAVSANGLAKLILFSNIFYSNNGAEGGAIYANNSQTAKITNVEFWSNYATTGGAAYFKDCQPIVYHATIASNKSNSGAVVADGAAIDMKNAIVWGNSANGSDGSLYLTNGGTISVDYATIEGGYATGTNISTDDPIFIDMLYGELRHKGHSPVIDAGAELGVQTDVLGLPRPQPVGGAPDLGAFERNKGIDVIGGFPVDNQVIVGLFSDFKLKFTENIIKGIAGGTISLYYENILAEKFDVATQITIKNDTAFFTATKPLKYGSYYIYITRDAFKGAVSGLGYYGTVSPKELNFEVVRPQIYVNPLAAGLQTGFDWNNAYHTVQQALSSSHSGQEIWISAGTFVPTQLMSGSTSRYACFTLRDGVPVLGGFSGIPGTEGQLSSRNTAKYATVFSGDLTGNDDGTATSLSDNAYHIIRNISAEHFGLTKGMSISGVLFTGGNADGAGDLGKGSAIFTKGSWLDLDSCSFTTNNAASDIVHFEGTGSEIIAGHALRFENNSATTTIYAKDMSLDLSNIVATNNSAGFISTSNTKLTTKKTSLSRNTAQSVVELSGGTASFENVVMHNNTAASGFSTTGTLPLAISHLTAGGNTFSNKTIAASAQTTLSVTNSILWANAASEISTGSISEMVDYNIISGGDVRGTHNSAADPLFYAPTAGYFTVIEQSPAIDAAQSSAVATDIRGIARPKGAGTDMGAFERKTGPYLVSSDPADEYLGSRKKTVTLTFTENIAAASGNIYIKNALTADVVQRIDVKQTTISGATLAFATSTNVNFGKFYITIDSAAIVSATDAERVFDGIYRAMTLNFEFHNNIKYVDFSATGANDGSSWDDAFVKLQDAIDACAAGDNIWVAQGTYLPTSKTDVADARSFSFILKNSIQIFGGFSGLDYEFANRDAMLYPTILSGDLDANDVHSGDNYTAQGSNAYHVLYSSSGNLSAQTAINGFTIAGGTANGSSAQHQNGGGLYLSNDSLILENIRFIGNSAQSQGGAIYANKYIQLTEAQFISNSATNGGALNLDFASSTVFNANDLEFKANSASQSGGAMWLSNASAASRILDVELIENTAQNGSAIALQNCTNPIFANILAYKNTASQSATIYNTAGNVTFTQLTLTGNTGATDAGVLAHTSGTMSIANTILWNNTAGAAERSYRADGSATITFDHSLVGGATASILSSNANINADPRFVEAAADNYALQPCSPAIDAGDNARIETIASQDIAGELRIIDGNADGVATADMGAFEWNGVCQTALCPAKYDVCWSGCVSRDWFDAANWSTLKVPTSTTAVYIPGEKTVCAQPIIIGQTATCKTIDINTTDKALLQIDTDKSGKLNVGL